MGSANSPGSGSTSAGSVAGQGSGGGGQGGLEAGVGRSASAGPRTAPLAGGRDETVEAPASGHGPSEVSLREGTPRAEAAARTPQQVALEALKAQEEALYAEPLPLSRREQVLRYFTALRERLLAAESD